MRKEISGGMTEQDARSMLQKRGILAFMSLAGSLPQKEQKIANFDDLPTFSVYHNNPHWNKDYPFVLWTYSLWLKCDEPLCCDCCDELEIWLQPSYTGVIRIVHLIGRYDDYSICCCCGEVCRDDIPF